MFSKSHSHLLATTRSCMALFLFSTGLWGLFMIIAGQTSFKIMELVFLAALFLISIVNGITLLGVSLSLLFRSEHYKELLFCAYLLILPILFFTLTIVNI